MRWRSHVGVTRVCLVLGATFVTCLAVEGVFRIAGIRAEYHRPRHDYVLPPHHQSKKENHPGFIPHAVVRSEYESNPRGYFEEWRPARRCGIDHRHNSQGWRDEERAVEKPPGTFRLLGLGDSYLWGQGVRRMDRCLNKLEALLNQHSAGPRFEAVNTGMFSLNTRDEAKLLRERGLQFSPDFVIVHFVLNDVEEDVLRPGEKVEFFSEYTAIYQRADWLSGHSRAWGWARQRFLKAVTARAYIQRCVRSFREDSAGWLACREALDDIQRTCRERGIGLLVVVFPFFHELDGDYPFQPVHDAVRRHCERRGIPHLDLRDAYRACKGPELWVHPTDQHPNEIAHGIAAQAMFDHLLAHSSAFGIPLSSRVDRQDQQPSQPRTRPGGSTGSTP